MASAIRHMGILVESRLAEAARGSVDALYELGMVFSSGAEGLRVDFIEAHKWFNLAALKGDSRAQMCRADIAADMTTREIAEAQRQARTWLSSTTQRLAA